MTGSVTRPPGPPGGFRRVLRWWATAAAFLGGLLVGVLLTGLLSRGAPLPATDGGTAAPTSSEAPAPGTAGATGELVVNAACLRAINAAQDMLDVLQDLGEALSEFNAARLDEIVRRLQPLQQRLDENSDECQVEGRVPTGALSASATSPTPSESIGASPTD